jgi:primosomal protein N' (replication factor Y)
MNVKQKAEDVTVPGKKLFAEVILPLPLPKAFTYSIPDNLKQVVLIGSRVIVQFGAKRILTGVVTGLHDKAPGNYEPKSLLDVLDEQPVVYPRQLQLYEWMSGYYMCTTGEVVNAALPSGLKLSSESKIMIHPDFTLDEADVNLNPKELHLLQILKGDISLTYYQAAKYLELKNAYHVIKSLISKKAVLIYEEVKDKYVPKHEKMVRLNPGFAADPSAIETLFTELEKFPLQVDLVLQYLKHVNIFEKPEDNVKGILKSRVLTGTSASAYKTLVKKNIFEEYTVIVPRFPELEGEITRHKLSSIQEEAKKTILELLPQKDAVLLHGITGSGKTEIYTDIILEYLEGGYQVLYLLPEIALTTHIVSRLKNTFGRHLAVYHSKHSDNERVEVWQGVLNGRFKVVTGVRSSIFLPFSNLGLIIVDEEHEPSYKQMDVSPRYHARDVALVMAKQSGARVILGSATPSIESFHHAQTGKYGYVKLDVRYGKAVLPEIKVVDTRKERKQKLIKGEFTSVLNAELEKALNDKKQAILFQNRRGYAPYIVCDDCGNIPQCHQCSVSLTYHLHQEELVCHYCGYKTFIPGKCEECGSTRLRTVGFGTEKIEDDLKLMLPGANIQRMDLDSTRSKLSYQKILDRFSNGSIDFLVGTQMVTKGLDFDNVRLVGILDADRMISFPDFRSSERAFQMMVQVSGRAGRREERGIVVIQTANPDHHIIKKVINNDFDLMVNDEIDERRKYGYPPFSRLVRLTVKHPDKDYARNFANQAAVTIREFLGEKRVLGPEENMIPRIRNEYFYNILIKLERENLNIQKAKEIILQCGRAISENKIFRKGKIYYDVDPY